MTVVVIIVIYLFFYFFHLWLPRRATRFLKQKVNVYNITMRRKYKVL
jgi:hypothetical protein